MATRDTQDCGEGEEDSLGELPTRRSAGPGSRSSKSNSSETAGGASTGSASWREPRSPRSLEAPSFVDKLRLKPEVRKKFRMCTDGSSCIVDLNGNGCASKALQTPSENTSSYKLSISSLDGSFERASAHEFGFGGMFTQGLGCFCCGGAGDEENGKSQSPTTPRYSLSTSRSTLSGAESLSCEQQVKMPPKRAEWWMVTLYIINDAIGSWLLLFSSLMLGMYGWILGIALVLLIWPMNLYTGHLLWRCRNVFPGGISIADLVYYLTRSHVAMYITMVFVNFTILMTLVSQMETAASSIYYFFTDDLTMVSGRCYVVFVVGVIVILFPITQIRYLRSLTMINIVTIACMLVFVVISLVSLAETQTPDMSELHLGPDKVAIDGFVSFDNDFQTGPILGIEMIFAAYNYQLIILEMIAEMKHPSEFPKACYWATPVILVMGLVTAVTQYYYLGQTRELNDVSVQEVLTSIFDVSTARGRALAYAGVICFTIRMIGVGAIRSIILTRSLQLLINPKSANKETWKARLEWAGISLGVLTLAWVFSIFANSLGVLTTANGFLAMMISVMLPIVLYIICCKKRRVLRQVPKREWFAMAFVFCFTLVVIILCWVKMGQRWAVTGGEPMRNNTKMEIEAMFTCTDLNFHLP